MTSKIVCDNCEKECTREHISIQEHTPVHCMHIAPINWDVCSVKCAIAMLKQVNDVKV